MNNKEMLDKFKMSVAISNFEKECERETNQKGIYTLEKRRFWREYIMKKRIIATTCVGMILMSGVVFAANIDNIKNYFRGFGNGIDTAIENGYVENPEMDYIELNAILRKETGTIIEDVKVDAKIEDFLMDDLNLSTQFSFEFDDKINNYIDLNNINDVTINDLFVREEENRLIYSVNDKEIFDKYCKENNLNYVFGEFSETYRVISCSNDDFEIYSSSVSDTGFEIGVIINNIERPEYPEELKEVLRNNDDWANDIMQPPYLELYVDFTKKNSPIFL